MTTTEDREPPMTAEEARRRRRWRTLIILGSISIGWKVLVFTLGAALPRWLIEDGLAELSPDHQSYGAEAKATALTLWTGPIEKYGFIRAVRVLRVDHAPADTSRTECGGLGARVKAYTYFAIPYSEVRTTCGEGRVLYRVLKRRGGDSDD